MRVLTLSAVSGLADSDINTPSSRAAAPAISQRKAADLRHGRAFCADIGKRAVRSLYAELTLYPKPGLVSLVDNGSHHDMDAASFMRSLFALRHYFIRITGAGMDGAAFSTLKQLGMHAEVDMLRATSGINTHRGAIFCIGMLCAAIGRCQALGMALSAQNIRTVLQSHWGTALLEHSCTAQPGSHGTLVSLRHAVGGAREEMAAGMPSVFELALPRLGYSLSAGRKLDCARIDALFALMAHITDTNVYHRGGASGARMLRDSARDFIAQGGTGHPAWRQHALACHQLCIRHKLSPGGAADLLAATCLLHDVIHVR